MRRAWVLPFVLFLVASAGSYSAHAPVASGAPPASSPALAGPFGGAHVVGSSAPHPGTATSADVAHGRTSVSGALARFPPPTPPLASPPVSPSYYGHYYVGSFYTGTNFTSHQLSTTLQIPLDVAQSTDFYYVILSLWDDATSYDQIGFANAGGQFGIAYSTTSPCAGQYYYSPDAYPLTPGDTYNFSMSISAGTVLFNVTYLNGTSVWSLSQATGGNVFVESSFFTCYSYYCYGSYCYGSNITAYDYTDYEEVYSTFGNLPPYDFFFGQNLADDQGVTAWSLFETYPPGPVTVPINGDNVVVANEASSLYLNQANATYALESPASPLAFQVQLGLQNVDASGSVTLSAYHKPSGWGVSFSQSTGVPPFTYTATVTVAAGTPIANESVGFNATDSSGDPNQLSVWFQIVPPLSVAIHLGPHNVADLGQNVTLTAVPGGGVGGLSYAWTGLPMGCPTTGQVLHCQPSETGNFLISVSATDSAGDVGVSPVFGFVVNPDPSVSLVATPARADVNTTITFYAAGVSGAGGFVYTWPGLLPGCTASGAIATCRFVSPGIYTMSTTATDLAGYAASSPTASVTVLAAPLVVLALSSYTADVGQPVQMTATASGGGGGFTYAWTGLPGGCASTAPTTTCAFGSAGSFLVTVSAVDSFQVATPIARAYVTVSSDPVVQLVPSGASVDLGQSATFEVRVTGGAPGYSYAYATLPVGCLSSDVSVLTCTPSAVSDLSNVTVAVTDRNNWTVAASVPFAVYADPTVTLTVSPPQIAAGSTVEFRASVSGGAPGASYSWQNLPGGCQAIPSATISCAPPGIGATNVTVTVTDGNGYSVSASAVISVIAGPTVLSGFGALVIVGGVVAVAVIVVAVVALRRRSTPPPPEE